MAKFIYRLIFYETAEMLPAGFETPGSPGFNPDWKSATLTVLFPPNVQPGSSFAATSESDPGTAEISQLEPPRLPGNAAVVLVLSNLRADEEYDGEAVDEDDGDDVVEGADRRLGVARVRRPRRSRLVGGGVRRQHDRRHVARRAGQHRHQRAVEQSLDAQTKLDRTRRHHDDTFRRGMSMTPGRLLRLTNDVAHGLRCVRCLPASQSDSARGEAGQGGGG